MSKKNQVSYKTIGATGTPDDVRKFLLHVNDVNFNRRKNGERATPANICGEKGISKTSLVEQICKANGWGFKYIPLGQTEEVGDITGMPKSAVTMTKGDKSVVVTTNVVEAYLKDGYHINSDVPESTINIAPAWVPREGVDPERGILLFDDFNRGPRNVQQTIMQVLQNYEMNSSWNIPKGWDIVLTSNPAGGDYQVEELDDAQATRMLHINMDFDSKQWAAWAERAGVDSRGINFVLAHPECVKGERTCPRTLEQFFSNIKGIKDLKAEIDFVSVLGKSSLDDETVQMFLSYVSKDMMQIISSEDILSNDSKDTARKVRQFLGVAGGATRVDVVSIMCTRLMNYLLMNICSGKEEFTQKKKDNLHDFLMIDGFPNDLRLAFLSDLMKIAPEEGGKLMKNWVSKYTALVKFCVDKLS